MIGIDKNSSLLFYLRFGVGTLVIGGVATWLSVAAVRQFPQEGNAWLVLTLSTAMAICGLGTILYGWWVHKRDEAHGDRGDGL